VSTSAGGQQGGQQQGKPHTGDLSEKVKEANKLSETNRLSKGGR
jgi:hypothetical protein